MSCPPYKRMAEWYVSAWSLQAVTFRHVDVTAADYERDTAAVGRNGGISRRTHLLLARRYESLSGAVPPATDDPPVSRPRISHAVTENAASLRHAGESLNVLHIGLSGTDDISSRLRQTMDLRYDSRFLEFRFVDNADPHIAEAVRFVKGKPGMAGCFGGYLKGLETPATENQNTPHFQRSLNNIVARLSGHRKIKPTFEIGCRAGLKPNPTIQHCDGHAETVRFQGPRDQEEWYHVYPNVYGLKNNTSARQASVAPHCGELRTVGLHKNNSTHDMQTDSNRESDRAGLRIMQYMVGRHRYTVEDYKVDVYSISLAEFHCI
jgi:hypothetical protein